MLAIEASETPPELPDLEVSDAPPAETPTESARAKIDGAEKVVINPLKMKATEVLPPQAAAGVWLSKFVLWMMSGAILLLVVYLIACDLFGRSNMAEAYRHFYMLVENAGELIDASAVPPIITKWRGAKADSELILSDTDAEQLGQFLTSAARAKLISDRQKLQLQKCLKDLKLPDAPTCTDLLETAQKASAGAAVSSEKARMVTDFTKTIDEHQRSFQSFWLQVAQMILLNLLLPLLTGLFGYIFGTNQRTSAEQQ